MIKYLLVGTLVMLIYRFWNSPTKQIDKTGQEPDEFADYEEID